MWQQWTNVILGLVIAATPFLGLSAAAMSWTLLIAGLFVAAMGLWGAGETNTERRDGRMVHHRYQH